MDICKECGAIKGSPDWTNECFTVPEILQSKVGTFHPNPKAEVAWTVNDTRGYVDQGPSCDECGDCECQTIAECASFDDCEICRAHLDSYNIADAMMDNPGKAKTCSLDDHGDCCGLSFAFVCLDGGEALCHACAKKEGITCVAVPLWRG